MTLAEVPLSGGTSRSTTVGFLLLDQFVMLSLAAALKPLRIANQLASAALYSWRMISETGGPVTTADGLNLEADDSIHGCRALDVIVVAGGAALPPAQAGRLVLWLQQQARAGTSLGSICGGAQLLALAGLKPARPPAATTPDDADLALILNLIAREHGARLAAAVWDSLALARTGDGNMRRPVTSAGPDYGGEHKPRLAEVIELMESNLEEPIEPDHLAALVGISRRQMERLFQEYLDSSPSRYYLLLRLNRARELVRLSSMSITDIAAACGFVSTAHFSRCYRNHSGVPPRDERRLLRAPHLHTHAILQPTMAPA